MKFNCRDCPKEIRERCIQECHASPTVRLMMRRNFEAGTDTEQMWGLLQMNCLLASQAEQEKEFTRTSPLSQRLKGETKATAGSAGGVKGSKEPASAPSPPAVRPPRPTTPPRPVKRPTIVKGSKVEGKKEAAASFRYCLVPEKGRHRIALPAHGEIVLGRFDPTTRMPPDVDLSYEDKENRAISRRHVRIIGRNGKHVIEDLGSTNGTKVNGRRLRLGQKLRLQPGSRVELGYCEFSYVPIPEVSTTPQSPLPPAYLQVAFTGRRFPLPLWGEVTIGRSDRAVGFVPDIDLSDEEEAAQVVARRHVKIVARSGRHYMEDLGSANGTKLNGARIRINELRLLSPGDHLWLGGCVLAYDVELQSKHSDRARR